jgi:MOSC domain-containing protein YiiM
VTSTVIILPVKGRETSDIRAPTIVTAKGRPLVLRDAEQAAPSRRLFHSSPVGVKTAEYHYGEAENSKKYGLAYGDRLTYADARCNIVTRGVDLNHLVGRRFLVGDVKYLGQHLCEPCAHLECLTKPDTLKGLIRHGGLRANVLTAGAIAAGMTIQAQT